MSNFEDTHKELPLDSLRLSFKPTIACAPVFFDIHEVAVCIITARFRSVEAIEKALEDANKSGYEVYLYKLYEKLETYPGATPEKEMTYTLRHLIQARRGPDGKFLTPVAETGI